MTVCNDAYVLTPVYFILGSVRKRTPSEGSLKPESEHGPPDNSEIIFPPMHLMKYLTCLTIIG